MHRDLKPDNIMLTRDGRVKILDFGLAKVAQASASDAEDTRTLSLTQAGAVMGTVGYMSPEQVRGQEADHRSDIFSLGVVLQELLSGERAFPGASPVEVMNAILKEEPRELPETVPAGLRRIVRRCLEKHPVSRFQSARDLSFALSSTAETGSHPAAAPPTRPAPLYRVPLLALSALTILATAIGTVVFLFRQPSPPAWYGSLLGGPEIAMTARISPDGGMLAYQTIVGLAMQVGVMKPESGNRTVLTNSVEHGFVKGLCWSHDGARIYYDRWTDVAEGIYSVPVLGGDEQLILENAAYPEALPDGSLLMARLNAERQYQIFRYWPETGRVHASPSRCAERSATRFGRFRTGNRLPLSET